MENRSVKGCIVSRNEARELLLQPVGIRIRTIRVKLDNMYPGEFNLKKVADEAGFSENGLAKIETGSTSVQKLTVEYFERFFAKYNVPIGFFDKKPVSSMKPFYLGKPEDMLPYFNRFYESNGQKHPLDTRELPEIDDSDFRFYDPAIDTEQADVIETEEGGFLLDQVGVEITLNVYQVSTKQPLWEKRLNQMAVISPSELLNFERALRRDIDVLIRQYSELFGLKQQLKESQMREALLKARLYLRNQEQKSDDSSDLEREISALLDDVE
jgi:transcriptional regulator with XRE-family HTH domain